MWEIKEYKRLYSLAIIIHVEPKISGTLADEVCKKIGQNRWIRSESTGFSGGIWVLWNEEEVEVKLSYAHTSFLHAVVTTSGD